MPTTAREGCGQMGASAETGSIATEPSLAQLFTPKLLTVWREGYGFDAFRRDLIAGLTVAIVALPLSMGIAIASGVSPDRGLYTAIVGGFLVSALGGTRFQIGGPAGAFIVLVAAAVTRHGIDGVLLATMMAGVMLIAIGSLRLGTYIRLIPYPVTVGFTAGIAVIIMASQAKDFFGLTLASPEPGALLPKLAALADAAGTASPAATTIALATVLAVAGLRRWRPAWPGMLIAIAGASAACALLQLPVETIGTRFGGIPGGLPAPALPDISMARMQAVLPDAIAFALLGAIESLLSAVVADGMTGRRHRSNCELVAQGIANIGSALFGGICVTGTIARTATNVRAGAHGPVSGMLHSAFLLGFMLVAAPLASYIPLAALAGMLVVVAWNMVERTAFAALIRSSAGDAMVLLVTFLLVMFRDLTEGIVVGFLLGSILFIERMAATISAESGIAVIPSDEADASNGGAETGGRPACGPELTNDPDTVVYRISGAFFFGAASTIGAALDRIAGRRGTFILDCSAVPFLDSTAASVIESAAAKARRGGTRVFVTGASPPVRRMLMTHGVRAPLARYKATIAGALRQVEAERR